MSKRNSGWSQFFYSKFFLFILLAGIFFVGFAFIRSYYQDYQIEQEIGRLKLEAGNLETKKIETLEILKFVQSSDFAEKKARMEFNMVKPGEQVAIISGSGDSLADSRQENDKMVESTSISNIIKWWNFFTAN